MVGITEHPINGMPVDYFGNFEGYVKTDSCTVFFDPAYKTHLLSGNMMCRELRNASKAFICGMKKHWG